MVNMKSKNNVHWIRGLLVISISLFILPAIALDNPDAPDFIGEFKTREQVYLNAIDHPNNTGQYWEAYKNHLEFLDKELNKAYKIIRSKLPKKQKQELKISQRNWIKFRDAEFEFIDNNWTREHFGSSAGISIGDYKSSIIKNRVLQLLYYAINYGF